MGTRGVVSLFNAIQKRQSAEKEVDETVGASLRKRRIAEAQVKRNFFNALKKGNTPKDPPVEKKQTKAEFSDDDKPVENKPSFLKDFLSAEAQVKQDFQGVNDEDVICDDDGEDVELEDD